MKIYAWGHRGSQVGRTAALYFAEFYPQLITHGSCPEATRSASAMCNVGPALFAAQTQCYYRQCTPTPQLHHSYRPCWLFARLCRGYSPPLKSSVFFVLFFCLAFLLAWMSSFSTFISTSKRYAAVVLLPRPSPSLPTANTPGATPLTRTKPLFPRSSATHIQPLR